MLEVTLTWLDLVYLAGGGLILGGVVGVFMALL